MKKTIPMTGAYAAAEAMRQINPGVVAAYPITPQTPIIERFAEFVADGEVDTEFVLPESEHSALTIAQGAQAAGVRAMTASASQGLGFMWEVLPVTSGLRLPVLMNVATRALSAPLNIHCDHSDVMNCKDLGWLQFFCENPQEVYDYNFLALRLAEHPKVSLPAMVIEDGFVTSHCVENMELIPDQAIKKFIGEYKNPRPLLETDHPVAYGSLMLPDYYQESRMQMQEAMQQALKIYPQIAKELQRITKRAYPFFESYQLKDAKVAMVVLGSTAGTGKAVIDHLRKRGKKVGLLKLQLFRPFPYKEIAEALCGLKAVAVLDRSLTYGAHPPLYGEILQSLSSLSKKPKTASFVFGLGGREIYEKDIEKIFKDLLQGKIKESIQFIG